MSLTATSPRTAIAATAIIVTGVVCTLGMTGSPSDLLSSPPEVSAKQHTLSLTLHAAVASDGKNSFYFDGQPNAPTLRLSPGDQLKITYINGLPNNAKETCAITPCMDMTNLHFHGLAVSPDAPQDDVLGMIAAPGQTLHYTVQILKDHPRGLYWYHTHPHGESHRQALDGMSGAIVIEGIESYFPSLAGLPDSNVRGAESETPDEVFTLNGSVRPQIQIAPGERQFWRLLNASADRYVDLQVEGQTFETVAMGGIPIAVYDRDHPTRSADHVLLPPAGRLEAIVTGSPTDTPRRLVSRCVDTGPAGDPNPAMVLADIVPRPAAASTPRVFRDLHKADLKVLNLTAEEKAPPRFILTFTEDEKGFYINGEKFTPDSAPMVRAKVGAFQHWKVVNASGELHPMHIHQVHFLVYAENDKPIAEPLWLDTVNVPYGGSVDVVMDFTDPVIRRVGISLPSSQS